MRAVFKVCIVYVCMLSSSSYDATFRSLKGEAKMRAVSRYVYYWYYYYMLYIMCVCLCLCLCMCMCVCVCACMCMCVCVECHRHFKTLAQAFLHPNEAGILIECVLYRMCSL